MFNWKVEELALRADRPYVKIGRYAEYHFTADRTTSREDKIAFLDQMTDGKMSYLLGLISKYEKEAPDMPKDQYGDVKTVSLIAWCKRNDKKYLPTTIIDREYRHGQFHIVGVERYISSANRQGSYDDYADLVDEAFHRQLIKCLNEENAYFKSIDPYEIAKKQVRQYCDQFHTSFGMRLAFSSNDDITVIKDEETWKGPKITLDQCNLLISKYQKLEEMVATLTSEVQQQLNQ